MKTELEDRDIERIAKKVVEKIKHLPINQGNKEDEILTVDEVAKHLKVTVNWIYKKVSSKEIPYYKPGGSLRFRKKEIDEWFNGSYTPDVNISKINGKEMRT